MTPWPTIWVTGLERSPKQHRPLVPTLAASRLAFRAKSEAKTRFAESGIVL
jgi:hypothetical protein